MTESEVQQSSNNATMWETESQTFLMFLKLKNGSSLAIPVEVLLQGLWVQDSISNKKIPARSKLPIVHLDKKKREEI